MELEELKKEARKHGYYLQKAPAPYIRLKPCPVCGTNRRDHFIPLRSNDKYGMKCVECGLSITGTSKRDLHKKWNELYTHGEIKNEK